MELFFQRTETRTFAGRDTPNSEPAIIVNEVLARTLWAGQDSLGQEMAFDKDDRKVVVKVRDFPTVDLVDRSVSQRRFRDAMRAE